MLSRYALDALDLAVQKFLVRRRKGWSAVVDSREGTVYYRQVGSSDRLGPLEKRIILILAQESLSEAEIARRLSVWPQAVHRALKNLRRKRLVKSWAALGENLAGTKITRGFYALNPERVSIAVPLGSPTEIQLQWAKEKAQTEGIRRELEGIRRQRELSPKPLTRLKAGLVGMAEH